MKMRPEPSRGAAIAVGPPNPPKQIPASAGIPKRGDKVWVIIPGFGPVEADFVAALPDGQILIDLDGVQTPVEQAAVHADLLAAEAAAALPTAEPLEAPTAAPESPGTSAAHHEPSKAPEPSKALSGVPEPSETPEAQAQAGVPEPAKPSEADPGSASLS